MSKTKPRSRGFVVLADANAGVPVVESVTSSGRVAEWLCSGLQIRVRRFNSDLGLQNERPASNRFAGRFVFAHRYRR